MRAAGGSVVCLVALILAAMSASNIDALQTSKGEEQKIERSLAEAGALEGFTAAGLECLAQAGLDERGQPLKGSQRRQNKLKSVSEVGKCFVSKLTEKAAGDGVSLETLRNMIAVGGNAAKKHITLSMIQKLFEAKNVDLPESLTWDRVGASIDDRLAKQGRLGGDLQNYPFYQFIPNFVGSPTEGQTVSFATDCFKNVSVTAKKIDQTDAKVNYEITASGANSLICLDMLLFTQGGGVDIKLLLTDTLFKPIKYKFKADKTPGALLAGVGASIFQFNNLIDAALSFIQTFTLFWDPQVSRHPDGAAALDNSIFYNSYVTLKPTMVARNNSGPTVDIPNPKSGDLLLVGRMFGSDMFMSYVQGSSAPHIATILCKDSTNRATCNVCESRFQALWWPDNGVECNQLDTWLGWARNGSLHVRYLPLAQNTTFGNVTGALDFFNVNNGLDYAWSNLAYGGIDVTTRVGGNFPCLPPDFSSHCFDFHLMLFALNLVDAHLATFSWFFGSTGWANRLGQPYSTRVPQMQLMAYQKGMTMEQLTVLPELDNYTYFGLKNGETYFGPFFTDASAICNAFRVPGNPLAGVELQCNEQVVWDILALNFWDTASSMQIMGDYTLGLDSTVSSRAPSTNQGTSCPSSPPSYTRPEGC